MKGLRPVTHCLSPESSDLNVELGRSPDSPTAASSHGAACAKVTFECSVSRLSRDGLQLRGQSPDFTEFPFNGEIQNAFRQPNSDANLLKKRSLTIIFVTCLS